MASADTSTFVISRIFEAPRDLVFRAHTECEHLKHWWGPKGFGVHTCRMDLRPGGMFLYGLRKPDGGDLWGRWIFREITPPQRLVFVTSFSDTQGGLTRNPWSAEWPLQILSTVELTEKDGRTTVTVTWQPLEASEIEIKTFIDGHPSMRGGWTGTLEKLAGYLATSLAK
jgi:uncharacterized protein YndB with AHSA1/START domain